jgi:hypothetical protein
MEFEDVLRFAINEMGVQPVRADWATILGPSRRP